MGYATTHKTKQMEIETLTLRNLIRDAYWRYPYQRDNLDTLLRDPPWKSNYRIDYGLHFTYGTIHRVAGITATWHSSSYPLSTHIALYGLTHQCMVWLSIHQLHLLDNILPDSDVQ